MAVNMLKARKHSLNLRGGISVRLFDHSEIKSARNILC